MKINNYNRYEISEEAQNLVVGGAYVRRPNETERELEIKKRLNDYTEDDLKNDLRQIGNEVYRQTNRIIDIFKDFRF